MYVGIYLKRMTTCMHAHLFCSTWPTVVSRPTGVARAVVCESHQADTSRVLQINARARNNEGEEQTNAGGEADSLHTVRRPMHRPRNPWQ